VTLLRAADVSLSFGSRTLFRDLTLVVEEDERVGLVGVNGSGKSTLMRILAGELQPDVGELQLRRGARVTFLAQEPRFAPGATVAGELSVAQAPLREALEAHHALAHQLASLGADAQARAATQLAALADRIESLGGWDTEHHARTLLDRLGVKDWERPVSELPVEFESGWRSLARCSPVRSSCSSMSRQTTSTPTPWSGWRTRSTRFPARCCS